VLFVRTAIAPPAPTDAASLIAQVRGGALARDARVGTSTDDAGTPLGEGASAFLLPLLREPGRQVERLRDALAALFHAAGHVGAGYVAVASPSSCVVLTIEKGQVLAIRGAPGGPPLSTLAVNYRQLDAARAAGRDTPAALREAGLDATTIDRLVLAGGVVAVGQLLVQGPWSITTVAHDVASDRSTLLLPLVDLLRRAVAQRDDEAALRAALALPEGTAVDVGAAVLELPPRESSLRAMCAELAPCAVEKLLPAVEAGVRARLDALATVAVLVACDALRAAPPRDAAPPEPSAATTSRAPPRMPTAPGLSVDLIAASRAAAVAPLLTSAPLPRTATGELSRPAVKTNPGSPAGAPASFPPTNPFAAARTNPGITGVGGPPQAPPSPSMTTNPGLLLSSLTPASSPAAPAPSANPPSNPFFAPTPRTSPGMPALAPATLAPAASPSTLAPAQPSSTSGAPTSGEFKRPAVDAPTATSGTAWAPPAFDAFVARRAFELNIDAADAGNRDALENEYLEKAVKAGVGAGAWVAVLPLAERWFFKVATDPTALISVMRARLNATSDPLRRREVLAAFEEAAAAFASVPNVQLTLAEQAAEFGDDALVKRLLPKLKKLAPNDPRTAALADGRKKNARANLGDASGGSPLIALATFGLVLGLTYAASIVAGFGAQEGAHDATTPMWLLRHAILLVGIAVLVGARGAAGRAQLRSMVSLPELPMIPAAFVGGGVVCAGVIALLATMSKPQQGVGPAVIAAVLQIAVHRTFFQALQPSFQRHAQDALSGVVVLAWMEAAYAFTYWGVAHSSPMAMLTWPMLVVVTSAVPCALWFARSNSLWLPVAWELGSVVVELGAPRL
jgi:hypothetical protein